MILEIWSPGDDNRHYWVDAPVWKTLCGQTISTPYTAEERLRRYPEWTDLCLECGKGAETLFEILRQDKEQQ